MESDMKIKLTISNDQDARKALELLTEFLAKDWEIPSRGLALPKPFNLEMHLIEMNDGILMRTHNVLRNNCIETLGQLIAKTEQQLLSLPGFGAACLEDVKQTLAKMDLSLALTKAREA